MFVKCPKETSHTLVIGFCFEILMTDDGVNNQENGVHVFHVVGVRSHSLEEFDLMMVN